jgi:hypothetical protein
MKKSSRRNKGFVRNDETIFLRIFLYNQSFEFLDHKFFFSVFFFRISVMSEKLQVNDVRKISISQLTVVFSIPLEKSKSQRKFKQRAVKLL